MSNLNPLNAYRETKIKTASQGNLILMLYDEAIKQINEAIRALDAGKAGLDRVNNAILRAQEMITELMVSLDFDKGGEIAQNLFNLYMYFNNQLMEANVSKDAAVLSPIADMMTELRSAWAVAAQKTPAPNQAQVKGINIAG